MKENDEMTNRTDTEAAPAKATIIDVAKKAGVSMATVSRVVNGNYPVREETRRKVQAAIDELHYVPNMLAREFNTQRSMTIGVIVPGLYNMFFSEVIDGIEDYVHRDEYSLLLCNARNDSKLEADSVATLISRNVSGIIVISPNTKNMQTRRYEEAVKQKPIVFIDSIRHLPHASYVANNETAGTEAALTYLYREGHRNILFVGGRDSDSYTVKEERYCQFMKRQEIFQKKFILNIGEGNGVRTVDNTEEFMQTYLTYHRGEATAVFCCNDLMAVGVLNACKKLGIAVPDELSITGYDNTSLSRYVDPQLTTVDQNMKQLGQIAAKLLFEKIATGKDQSIFLQNKLIIRGTTGPCPQRD